MYLEFSMLTWHIFLRQKNRNSSISNGKLKCGVWNSSSIYSFSQIGENFFFEEIEKGQTTKMAFSGKNSSAKHGIRLNKIYHLKLNMNEK